MSLTEAQHKLAGKFIEEETEWEDSWHELSPELDLNLFSIDGQKYATVYRVYGGKTDTTYIVASWMVHDICPVCKGTIHPWDSGCQNCL